MSEIPPAHQYTEEHEYVAATDDKDVVQIGITDYAQGELGDVVYVELPALGAKFGRMDVFGTIEAVKAVSELYTPLAGTVMEVNGGLEADPAVINRDPYVGGWMVGLKIDPDKLVTLMKAADYKKHIGE